VGSSSLALALEPLAAARARKDTPTPPSFDDVYEQTFDFAWRSARRLGVAASAVDDVVQDVFLVVHRRLPEFEGRAAIKTWVFGILLRVVSDHRRTHRRKGGLAELPHDDLLAGDLLAGRSSSPTELLEKREAADVLHALLDEMDDEKRAVFVLAELEELPAPVIAEMVGVPVNTVYSRLRAARETFERGLARHRAREQGAVERMRAKERP
jgi:RNA polymerase sigma-70 factor (ECF subfamily)